MTPQPEKPHPMIEPDLHRLASRRLRQVLAVSLGLLALAVGARTLWVLSRQAAPQQAAVYGRWNLTPGSASSYRVFVRDARDAAPLAGADVHLRLVSAAGKTVWQEHTATDDYGFATAEPRLAADVPEGRYTLSVHTSSDLGQSEVSQDVTVERSFRVLVSTDKPLYQPGQVIHVRTLALATADLRPVAAQDIVVEVLDANGNKVFKKRLPTSDYGLAAADFRLADQVATGDYKISATVDDTVSERTVTVERYRLPKFRVDVSTEASYFAPGDTVRGEVVARYTFGEPVVGARVQLVASELVERLRAFAEIEGTTDRQGRFPFTLQLKDHFVGQPLQKGDALVSFEVTVTDPAAHAQTRTLQRTVTEAPIRVDVVPESGSLVPGVPNLVYVVTSYPDGAPAPADVEIEPYGLRLRTDEAGLATAELLPATGEVTVSARDDRGVRVRVTRQLTLDSQAETLLLRIDRAVYRSGETARLVVLSGTAPTGRVFVDVVKDRRTTLTKALDVDGGRAELALDLPDDLFGTLELSAYRILTDGTLVRDTKVVQVLRASELEIRAQLDRETYRPGDKAVLDFFVTREGVGGVPAALSLSGVDEAVFALQEMRPGLERVYFALLEELLEPRYEIHGRLPMSPEDVFRPAGRALPPDLPRGGPWSTGAAAVTFSAASGDGGPEAIQDASYGERVARLKAVKRDHLGALVVSGAVLPALLAPLLTLPLLLYALLRLFRGRPLPDASSEVVRETSRALRSVLGRWCLALALPPLAAFLGFLVSPYSSRTSVTIFLFGLTAMGLWILLTLAANRFRRTAIAGQVPLFSKFQRFLPDAYFFGVLGFFTMGMSENSLRSPGEGFVVTVVGVTALLWVAAGGALAMVGRGLFEHPRSRRGWTLAAVTGAVVLAAGLGMLVTIRARRQNLPAPMMAAMVQEMRALGYVDEGRAATAQGDVLMKVARTEAAPASPSAPAAPARVRRYFPETLLWEPELITDDEGHARLELPLADSITTWRVALSAVSRLGELGSDTLGLRVFQDFFVDLDLPVALTQNDRVTVPVAVYNYLDRPQTVRIEVRRDEWFELSGDATRTLDLAPKEVTHVDFRITARQPGGHALQVEARGTAMADAVEREVRVEPDGQPFVETLNGTLAAAVEHDVVIPDAALDGAGDLLVKIYPSAFSQVLEGLDGLFRMPFGCFEQTSSTTYPNVLALDYLRRTKQARPEVELTALEYIGLGYQRLLTFEVKGGGFEWFGQDPAHTVLTAYGLLEFNDMSRVYEVDPAVIARTRDWLYSQQQGDGSWRPTEGGIAEGAINAYQGQVLRTTAYVAWAMASSGESDPRLERALDYVAENIAGEDDPYTLALSANALLASQGGGAKNVLQRLDGMKQEDGDLAWWTSESAGVTYSGGDVLAIETTALVAYAFLEGRYRTDVAHKALAWLIEKKDAHGTWHSTQATVHALRVLLRGADGAGGVDGDVEVTVAVNGTEAEAVTITEETSDVYRLISLRELVDEGSNRISIDVDGGGNLAYQIVATHYRPWPERGLPEREEELSIELEYDTVDLATDDVLTGRVTVRYNRPGAVDMAIVDLGIPPGFELLTDELEAMLAEDRIERYSVSPRQVILYFRRIESGRRVEFEYRLRARSPVRVKTPRSAVYPYYEPALRDETEPVVLTVR